MQCCIIDWSKQATHIHHTISTYCPSSVQQPSSSIIDIIITMLPPRTMHHAALATHSNSPILAKYTLPFSYSHAGDWMSPLGNTGVSLNMNRVKLMFLFLLINHVNAGIVGKNIYYLHTPHPHTCLNFISCD